VEAHHDFDKALLIDDSNPKLYHGKGLGFQAQAEHYAISSGEDRDLDKEQDFVYQAIHYFKKALEYEESFISSMFHLGLMYRRIAEY